MATDTDRIKRMKKILALITVVLTCSQLLSAKVPVYIVAGQSNADGRAFIEEMPEAVRHYAETGGAPGILMSYCYGSVNNELGVFKPYVPMYEGGKKGKCGFDAVLYCMMADSAATPFYVIKESKGGTAIDTLCKSSQSLYWNASPQWLAKTGIASYNPQTRTADKNSLLLQLEANIDSCIVGTLASIPEGYEFKCIIWHQGESDRKQGKRYYSNLKALVDHLRSHIAEATGDDSYRSLPFIAGGVNKESRQYNEDVELAKIRLAEEDSNFHYINLDGCELRSDDQLHFNGRGAAEAAKRFYGCLKSLDLLPRAQTAEPIYIAPYYGGKEAAVCYTFDDGLLEHYTVLRDQLKKHGFVATFGIIGSKVGRDHKGTPVMTWEQLRQLQSDGHEISNHGWEHRNVTTLSPDELRHEIRANDSIIHDSVGVWPRSFIYPGNRHDERTVAICEADKAGSRVKTKNLGGRNTENDLRRWVNELILKNEWAITMTHGISYGYDHFKDPDVLWRHFDYVDSLREHIWVGTLADVSAYVKERQFTRLSIDGKDGVIKVTPEISLDKQIFQMPLTMVFNSEKSVMAEQDGRELMVRTDGARNLIDFDPHGGTIIICER